MKDLNYQKIKKAVFVFVIIICTVISFNSCNFYSIKVRDISQDIMNYETQKVPSILQQSGTMLYGKEVTGITFDSLVLYGCNSIDDELSEDISYNGYFVTTWDIQKTNRKTSSTEQKTVYVNISDLTIKKDGKQYSYEWHTDYNSAFNSIRWE